MKVTKKLMVISALMVVFFTLCTTKLAYAHFQIGDTKTGVKAIFHVTPDHSPVAGKESVISYDFAKTGFQTKDYSFSLKVKSTKGEAVAIQPDITGNVVLANYTFPSQGFYGITLTATRKGDGVVSKLQYGQRVSRGVVIEQKQPFGTIEIGTVAGAALIAVAAIVFSLISDSNKRKVKKK